MTFAEDYVPVPVRIQQFYAKYPEGSIQPLWLDAPYRVIGEGQTKWLVYGAAAYRHPDDPRPGVGLAWEQVPGKTPYTRGSELQNAETSAWGRALAALGFVTSKSVASAEEVRSSQEATKSHRSAPSTARVPSPSGASNGAHSAPQGPEEDTAW